VGLVVRRLARVPGGVLRAVVPGNTVSFADDSLDVTPDEPSWRHTSIEVPFRAGELAAAVERVRKALDGARSAPPADPATVDDPETRLRLALRDLLGAAPPPAFPPLPGVGRAVGEGGQGGEGLRGGPLTPVVVVAVGDLDEAEALRLLEQAFGGLPARRPPPASPPLRVARALETLSLPGKAQSEIGYAVPAAGPASPDADAWRVLLYVMSHGYEGRLGKELIARLGLLYYIDSRYDTDGRTGWISLVTGVDPDRLEAARGRFTEILDGLRREPPTAAEVAEAQQHLIGRRITAPMSDDEISAAYAREWIEQGRLLTDDEHARRVRAVSRERVLALVPRFLAGATAVVDVR
jgi:hypothetical protein